jgi:hypothetical protein
MALPARIVVLLIGAAAGIIPQSAAGQDQMPKRLAAMTPGDFEKKIVVTDDPLERHVVISSHKAFRQSATLGDGMARDIHMRALVDRQTGATQFQIWHDIAYWGQRKSFYQVNYIAQGNLHQTDLLVVAHRADDCPAIDGIGSCSRNKTLAFEVPESVMRDIARQYTPRSRSRWTFRFKDQLGLDVTSGIAPAEAAGLLSVLDMRRATAPPQSTNLQL